MKQLVYWATVAGLLFILSPAFSQTLDLEEKIPIDPDVRTGLLDNGLRYYIRQNQEPKNRLELRLAVDAGSILETEQQLGLAHFVEHMCFNGTEKFDKQELVDFLETSGVRFGPDLNAYTSFDETVYLLQLPTDRQGLVDTAFMVLEEWAHQVKFDEEEIDKERGVIEEEWRLGLGASDRMRQEYFPIIFKGSRYAERLPIGDIEVIRKGSYQSLKAYYYDWYRPNLMAVAVVGDIDPDVAEEKIKYHFEKLSNPKNEKERVYYDLPPNKDPLIAISSDPEATNTQVLLFYKHEKTIPLILKDYRRQIVFNLFTGMLNERLNEIAQKPDAPFVYAGVNYGGFLARSKDAYLAFSIPKENQIEQALTTLMIENERVKKFGFNQSELDRQKKQLLAQLEKSLKEKDKTNSKSHISQYVAHFLQDEPIPGIAYEFEKTSQLLPNIEVEEINQVAKKLITQENQVILVTAPEREEIKLPTEELLLEAIEVAEQTDLKPFVDEVVEAPLLNAPLPGSGIAERSYDENTGVTHLRLENGVELFLKPTDFKNDEILMSSYAEGGVSVVEDAYAFTADNTAEIINKSGLGPFNDIALKKQLSGQVVEVNAYMNDLKHGLRGSSTPKAFETLLQLSYMYFTQSRKDADAFEVYINEQKERFQFLLANPQVVFYDTLYKLATQNDPRVVVIPSIEQIEGLKHDRVMEIYQSAFSNANGQKFFFVGAFEIDSILPLLQKYLGSLPSDPGMKTTWRDVSPEFPEGKTEATVYKGTEPKSYVAIFMEDAFDWNPENRMEIRFLMKILSIKLRESMREDQGGVYGVMANQMTELYPKPIYSIQIMWGCNPNNVDTLVETVFREMEILKTNGPTPEDLAKAKETFIRERETSLRQNRSWLSRLEFSEFTGFRIVSQDEYVAAVNAMEAGDIKAAANTYFDGSNYLKVVLKPESMQE